MWRFISQKWQTLYRKVGGRPEPQSLAALIEVGMVFGLGVEESVDAGVFDNGPQAQVYAFAVYEVLREKQAEGYTIFLAKEGEDPIELEVDA